MDLRRVRQEAQAEVKKRDERIEILEALLVPHLKHNPSDLSTNSLKDLLIKAPDPANFKSVPTDRGNHVLLDDAVAFAFGCGSCEHEWGEIRETDPVPGERLTCPKCGEGLPLIYNEERQALLERYLEYDEEEDA
jgi:hypothetical protein